MQSVYSLIPNKDRIGLICANCNTKLSVKYLHNNGNHYCNVCILKVI